MMMMGVVEEDANAGLWKGACQNYCEHWTRGWIVSFLVHQVFRKRSYPHVREISLLTAKKTQMRLDGKNQKDIFVRPEKCASRLMVQINISVHILGEKNTQLSKPRSASKTRSWLRARAGWGPQRDTNRLQRSGGIKSRRFLSFIYQRGRHDRHRSNMSWSSCFQFLAKRDLFEKHTSRKWFSNESHQWNDYFSTNVIL